MSIYGQAPGYLSDVITIKEQPSYSLRSANGLISKYLSLKMKKTSGDHAFLSAAQNLWNDLPLHIHRKVNFERFKSHLFICTLICDIFNL